MTAPKTDCALLELAAKAAGLAVRAINPEFDGGFDPDRVLILVNEDAKGQQTGIVGFWMPLDDDGDRHRLLVALKMTLAHEPSRGGWSCGAVVDGTFRWLAFDEDEARAVVVAAAAIGEAMP